jgi:hypothetical protein
MKTLNPRFISIYRGSWRGMKNWGWGSILFRIAFAGSSTKNLPKNDKTQITRVTSDDGAHTIHLFLKPFVPSTRKSCWGTLIHNSAHRVFVVCDLCNKEVPAGRIHQHKC